MRDNNSRPAPVNYSIREYLRRQGLFQELESLATLNRLWDAVTSSAWRDSSWVEGWNGAALRIGVSYPSVATRLRFESTELVDRLRKEGLQEVQELHAVVRPLGQRSRRRRHRRYSPEAAARVATTAKEISDPGLQSALLRLAGHLDAPPGSHEEEDG